MKNDKVWATEVEIYFTAAFINADIYCLTTNTVKKSPVGYDIYMHWNYQKN